MKINELMGFENKIFYCDEHDLYVKVVNNNGLEVIASRDLGEFTHQSQVLEQIYPLETILNMDFVEVSTYTIGDILDISNVGKIYNIKGSCDHVYIESYAFNSIPVAKIAGSDEYLAENHFLSTILDMRFVEVK